MTSEFNADIGFLGICLLAIFFYGDPDIADAIIKVLFAIAKHLGG